MDKKGDAIVLLLTSDPVFRQLALGLFRQTKSQNADQRRRGGPAGLWPIRGKDVTKRVLKEERNVL